MKNKIALITGGSRGLGQNAALHLARKDIDVIVTYHSNKNAAEAVVQQIENLGGKSAALQLDKRQLQDFSVFKDQLVSTLHEKWGRLRFDFLVNNAGFGIYKSFAETTEEDFDQMYAVHLKGVFFLTQQLHTTLEDGGQILNVSSGLTRFSLPGYSAYASMKGGIEVLSQYLAKELGDRQIAVNTLAPGAIETDFGGGAVRDNKDLNQLIASSTAMGRAGLPDDIGSAIASILSNDNQWMTAQRIEVSGGQNI
jgi:NAD(P)-dependent dehydrogenase (short-subunit alcohol dehydrogenase family)